MKDELEKINDYLDRYTEGYFESYNAALSQVKKALELHGIAFPANDPEFPSDTEMVYKIVKDDLPKDLSLYIAINPSEDFDRAYEAYAQIVDKNELDALIEDDSDENEEDDSDVQLPSFSHYLRQTRRTSDD